MSLKDKIVFITGATAGIGAACAEAFAKQGAKLILAARSSDKLALVADQVKETFNIDVLPLVLDVRQRDAVESAISQLPAAWQAIDVLYKMVISMIGIP